MTSEAAFTIKALCKCYMNDFEQKFFHPSIDDPMDSAFASGRSRFNSQLGQ